MEQKSSITALMSAFARAYHARNHRTYRSGMDGV